MGDADTSDPKVVASINAAMEAANDLNMVGCFFRSNCLQRAHCIDCKTPYLPSSQKVRCMLIVGHPIGSWWQTANSMALQYSAVHFWFFANLSILQLMMMISLMHPHITHTCAMPCTGSPAQHMMFQAPLS